jgi:hypothetical protein
MALYQFPKTCNQRFFDCENFQKPKTEGSLTLNLCLGETKTIEVINNINQTAQEIWFQASLL